MEKKTANILMELTMLLLLLVAGLGFVACGDEEDEIDIYRGYVNYVSEDSDAVSIKVTKQPSNWTVEMPSAEDKIWIDSKDYSDITFKENQKVTFKILQAKGLFVTMDHYYYEWRCKILILSIK